MYSLKTKGIIIKRTNYGEADRILTILSERFGKIKAIAKGVRKISSHMAGSLEPFMLVDLQLHEGKTFYIVTGASIIADFPSLHKNLKKISRAYYVGELIDKFLEEKEKSDNIFRLFQEILSSINSECKEIFIKAFELKIIEETGFKPELYHCVHCKEKLISGENYWDQIEGGTICTNCQQIYKHGKKITDEAIKMLRFIEKSDLEKMSCLKFNKNIENELEAIISEYIVNILERELKSKKFMEEVKAA